MMIDLLISYSGGLIKDERQAKVVLVAISLTAAFLAVLILFTQSKTLFKPRPTKVEFITGQEEYYRTVQPFE